MFKRRDRRPFWRIAAGLVYPHGGWARAAQYVKHRLQRLPDTPEKIARGIAAGVFASFTPFYGLHFLIAWLLALALRGNVLAALLGTFFGNPFTYLPIGIVALGTGHLLLGMPFDTTLFGFGTPAGADYCDLACQFANAGYDLWHNFTAIFSAETSDWTGLAAFYAEVFYPYMIGCILPGGATALVIYYLSVPVIRAYQHRRKKLLRAKLEQLTKKPPATDDPSQGEDRRGVRNREGNP